MNLYCKHIISPLRIPLLKNEIIKRNLHNYIKNKVFGTRFQSLSHTLSSRKKINDQLTKSNIPAIYKMDAASLLLQKNLIQRNNSIFQSGSSSIRCTTFDKNGTKIASPIDIKRDDLIRLHGLLPRDFRKLERTGHSELVPSILIRRKSILLSILSIRALIKPDMVIIFHSLNFQLDSVFLTNLEKKLKDDTILLPYEFRVLESILVYALQSLTNEMKILLSLSNNVLEDLEYGITTDKLRILLAQNKGLSAFHKKVILLRDLLDDLLEDNESLDDMYISQDITGHELDNDVEDNHSEIEMLIETYYTRIDEIVQRVEAALSNVKTTEEIINIILDSNRNQLMLLGIKFGIGMLSMGSIMFIGSVYGMNLENFIEETNYGFPLTIVIGVVGTIWLFRHNIKGLSKVQKLSIMMKSKKR